MVNQHFPEYCQILLEQLNVQKYYSAFCDIVVRVEDVEFRLHKCVLAGASSKLQSMLYNMRQECANVLALEDVTLNGFRIVMDFMYTGFLKMNSMYIQDVLATAQYLELHEVEKTCLDMFKMSHLGGVESSHGQQHGKGLGCTSNAGSLKSQLPALPTPVSTNPTLDTGSAPGPGPQPLIPLTSPEANNTPGVTTSPVPTSQVEPAPASTIPAPLSQPAQPLYSNPIGSVNVDTNYIEDYLKLIESLQGDPAYSQQGALLQKQPQSSLGQSHSEMVQSKSGNPEPLERGSSSGISTINSQSYCSDTPAGVLDKTTISLMKHNQAMKSQIPQATTSSLLNVQTRFALAPNHPPNIYSAEEVRRTILNVLSQERFDDHEDSSGGRGSLLKNSSIPVTSVLTVGSASKNGCKEGSDAKDNGNEKGIHSSNGENSDEEEEDFTELSDREKRCNTKQAGSVNTEAVKSTLPDRLIKVEPDAAELTEKVKQKRKKKTPMRVDRRAVQEVTCSDTEGRTNSEERRKSNKSLKTDLSDFDPESMKADYMADESSDFSRPLKKRLNIKGKKRNTCTRCGRDFYKPDNLQKHMALHEKRPMHSCHVCCQKFGRSCELTRHLRTHSAEMYKCPLCDKEYSDPTSYRHHVFNIHQEAKAFYCHYTGCSFKSNKLSNVEKHAVIHSDVKTYQCVHCGKTFAQSNGLRSHMRSCLEQRAYLCDICGQKFNHLQSMKNHRRLHTGEKPHQCHDCGAKFNDHRNFKRHMRIHENIFPYPCNICNKKFRHSNSLKAHVQTHGKQMNPDGVSVSLPV